MEVRQFATFYQYILSVAISWITLYRNKVSTEESTLIEK